MNAQQYTAPQFNWRKIAYFSVVVCIALLGATEGFTQEKKKRKKADVGHLKSRILFPACA